MSSFPRLSLDLEWGAHSFPVCRTGWKIVQRAELPETYRSFYGTQVFQSNDFLELPRILRTQIVPFSTGFHFCSEDAGPIAAIMALGIDFDDGTMGLAHVSVPTRANIVRSRFPVFKDKDGMSEIAPVQVASAITVDYVLTGWKARAVLSGAVESQGLMFYFDEGKLSTVFKFGDAVVAGTAAGDSATDSLLTKSN